MAAPVITTAYSVEFDQRVQLAELMIHQQDVHRPFGLLRWIPKDQVYAVLTSGLSRIGSIATAGLGRRARRVRFEATDKAWCHGEGPVVAGPAESILMTLSG